MNNQEHYYMGIDNGGSLIKAAIFDQNGNEISVASKRVPISTPNPGWTQRNADEIWQTNCSVIREVLAQSNLCGNMIRAISFSGYGGGIGLLDAAGKPVAPFIVSTDTRASNELSRFYESGINDKLYEYTLQNLWAGQPAVLLPWLAKYQPEVLEATEHIIMIKDYIRFRFTREILTDFTDAACTNLMNLYSSKFDYNIFKLLGIEDCFSKMPKNILVSSDIAGYITNEAALACGLEAGTPVATGLYDVSSCCLASQIIDDKSLCLITGTWSINAYLSNSLKECIGKYGTTLAFLPEYYVVEESSPTSASNLDWFLDKVLYKSFPNMTHKEIYTYCDQLALKGSVKGNEIIFLPYLYASNSHPNAKGSFFNMTADAEISDIITAIFEGIIFSSCYHIEKLFGTYRPNKIIRLSGGITNSAIWTQMFSDILQLPIEVMKGKERGALGAAMCASIAGGEYPDFKHAAMAMTRLDTIYNPSTQKADYYFQKYLLYKKAMDALTVFYD